MEPRNTAAVGRAQLRDRQQSAAVGRGLQALLHPPLDLCDLPLHRGKHLELERNLTHEHALRTGKSDPPGPHEAPAGRAMRSTPEGARLQTLGLRTCGEGGGAGEGTCPAIRRLMRRGPGAQHERAAAPRAPGGAPGRPDDPTPSASGEPTLRPLACPGPERRGPAACPAGTERAGRLAAPLRIMAPLCELALASGPHSASVNLGLHVTKLRQLGPGLGRGGPTRAKRVEQE